MRARREKDALILSVSEIESQVLDELFSTMIENYRVKPEELDPKARGAWYSTRGCESARMSPEETKDWLDQLYGYKSSLAQRLEEWRKQLARQTAQRQWRIKLDDAPFLLLTLNDHRLLAAARHDIGQAEMDTRSLGEFVTLKPDQQAAVYEIEFLGIVMEVFLRLLDQSVEGDPV